MNPIALPNFVCHRAYGPLADDKTCGQCVHAVMVKRLQKVNRSHQQVDVLTCAKTASAGHLNDGEPITWSWRACAKFERRPHPARAA